MNISKEAVEYIENNIDLIDNNDWEEFFKNAPKGIGEVLYNARIPFMDFMGKIPDDAFWATDVVDIIVPNSVARIGLSAFGSIGDCEIYYKGTKQQWCKIYNPNIFERTDFIVHCADKRNINIERII